MIDPTRGFSLIDTIRVSLFDQFRQPFLVFKGGQPRLRGPNAG